jgi:hypothetical protein
LVLCTIFYLTALPQSGSTNYLADGPIDTHPLALLFACYAVVGLCLVFVPPRPIPRYAALCLLVAFVSHAIRRADGTQVRWIWKVFFGQCTCGVVLYAHYFLCLKQFAPPPNAKRNIGAKALWAMHLISNPRGIRTPWQIRNIPPFSRSDKNYVPSRRRFLCERILAFSCLYALASCWIRCQLVLPLYRDDFHASKVAFFRRLNEVTAREILVRLYFPLNTFVPLYLNHRAVHCLVSSVAVTLGDDPAMWPRLYGDISEAYTLRRFWRYSISIPFETQLWFNSYEANSGTAYFTEAL